MDVDAEEYMRAACGLKYKVPDVVLTPIQFWPPRCQELVNNMHENDKKILIGLNREGKTVRQVAKELKKSPSSVPDPRGSPPPRS